MAAMYIHELFCRFCGWGKPRTVKLKPPACHGMQNEGLHFARSSRGSHHCTRRACRLDEVRRTTKGVESSYRGSTRHRCPFDVRDPGQVYSVFRASSRHSPAVPCLLCLRLCVIPNDGNWKRPPSSGPTRIPNIGRSCVIRCTTDICCTKESR